MFPGAPVRSSTGAKAEPTALESLQITADELAFSAAVSSPFGQLSLAFTGSVDGDEMKGKCKTKFGVSDFTASREA